MINTEKFIKDLIDHGYTHICAVPCSFAKNLINAAINQQDYIKYIPCASEAVAASVCAGIEMSGQKPILVMQSSGIPNAGSCITSLLKPYGIRFPIIVSWRTYEEGDSEIQHKHLAKNLFTYIESIGYAPIILKKENIEVIQQINACETANNILILEKETFSNVRLQPEYQINLTKFPRRSDYLDILNRSFKSTNFNLIGTTGNTAREMYQYMADTKNFYMAGNMGGALSIAVGAKFAGRHTIVCGGDAEYVMHMGGLTTAARYGKDNSGSILYIIFDNESNKSTGGQATYQDHIDYIGIAKASGLTIINPAVIVDRDEFEKAILSYRKNPTGVNFIHVKCSYDPECDRPPLNTVIESKDCYKV